MKEAVKRFGPFTELYLAYSKWRWGWREASDLGSGGHATDALLESPMGIGEDSAGNVYVSTRRGRSLWKIDPSRKATIIAGSENPSHISTEFIPARVRALEANLLSPEGLVVDRDSNVLLADSWRSVIFKITPDGWRTVYAGNGAHGYGGDGGPAIDASAGHAS